jgi:hypothetical protein
VTKDFPYQVAGAQQDNSTVALPSEDYRHRAVRSNSTKPGIGFAYEVGGGESGYIAQDPKNPDIFYAGSQGALLTRINRMTGQVRDVQVYPRFFSGEEAKTLPERWQWTYPIVFSPVDPNVLFTCSQHVWKTTNEGQSWEKISPDLTYNDSTTLGVSGGVITRDMNGPEIYGTVFALAPSYQDVNIIWAGSDDGLIHITKDGGKNWENITPKDMPKNTRVSIIEASHFNAGTAYIAAKRYQMDDRTPYIWKTNDFGKTWTKIITGIRADDYVHAVREDITRAGLLYAGTEHGVWVSYNDGGNWESLSLNLPDVQERVELFKEHEQAAKDQITRCATVHGNLVVLDLRKEETIFAVNRFMIYAIYPECNISIHMFHFLFFCLCMNTFGVTVIARASHPHDPGSIPGCGTYFEF